MLSMLAPWFIAISTTGISNGAFSAFILYNCPDNQSREVVSLFNKGGNLKEQIVSAESAFEMPLTFLLILLLLVSWATWECLGVWTAFLDYLVLNRHTPFWKSDNTVFEKCFKSTKKCMFHGIILNFTEKKIPEFRAHILREMMVSSSALVWEQEEPQTAAHI